MKTMVGRVDPVIHGCLLIGAGFLNLPVCPKCSGIGSKND